MWQQCDTNWPWGTPEHLPLAGGYIRDDRQTQRTPWQVVVAAVAERESVMKRGIEIERECKDNNETKYIAMLASENPSDYIPL